jgi:hypothetical protein
VSRQHHRALAAQAGEQLAKAHPLLGVQPGGRLVQQQQLRVGHDRLGDPDPPAHPTRQGADLAAGQILELDRLEGRPDPPVPVGRVVQLLEDGQVVDELEHAEPRVEAEVLGQVAEPAPDLDSVAWAGGPPAVDPDLAGAGGQQGGQDADEGGLAGSVGPQQPGDARRQLQVEVGQGGDPAVALPHTLDANVGSADHSVAPSQGGLVLSTTLSLPSTARFPPIR